MNILNYAREIKRKIKTHQTIFIVGHQNLDLDAIGSALGLHYIIQKYRKESYIVIDDQVHELGVEKIISEQPKEILKQTVKLTNELTEIEQETLETLKKGQAILARRFIEDEKEFNLIMEEIKMKTNVFRELVDEGIEEGERKGRNEGIETVAKRMKKQNYPIEEIMNLTKLTKKEIENL